MNGDADDQSNTLMLALIRVDVCLLMDLVLIVYFSKYKSLRITSVAEVHQMQEGMHAHATICVTAWFAATITKPSC